MVTNRAEIKEKSNLLFNMTELTTISWQNYNCTLICNIIAVDII